jgi:nitrogen regulatory protein PII
VETTCRQNHTILLLFPAGMLPARYLGGGKQTKQTRMKRIEAVVKRSALDDFHRCAKQLGIFGFDLSEDPTKRREHQRLAAAGEYTPDATSRVKVDFAVLDEETKPTVHAVLESVHPDSIAIFKFDQDTQPQTSTRRAAQSRW